MVRRLKTKILIFLILFSTFAKRWQALLILLLLYSLFSIPDPVFAQPSGCINTPYGLACNASGVVQAQQLLTRLINISVTIAFMAVTVWLVWSALKLFITSGGDPKALAHAWSSVTWTFMGLFFMVLAWLVLKLIFAVTGADVTSYCLGFPPYCV